MLKFYRLGDGQREVSGEWMERTERWEPDMEITARERAIEVAPDVRVLLLSISPVFGAVIAVWDDRNDWAGKGFTRINDESAQ